MDTKKIEEFLSLEYKEFAMYSLESRAIASMIDGFKPVQRKIIYISSKVWKSGLEKPLKIFQLSGKVASDCLEYNTKILLANGDSIKIGDWFHNFPDVKLDVVCVNESGNVEVSTGHNPVCSEQNSIYEIETEDGVIHKMSANHMVMLSNGIYKKASDLDINDDIKSIS